MWRDKSGSRAAAGRGRGNGKWACFKCQVYLCGWECVSAHANTGIGNTCPNDKWIYKSQEDMLQVRDGPTQRA